MSFLILTNANTDLVSVTAGSATTLDIYASYADLAANGSGDPTPGRSVTAMTTATTATIVGTPGASLVRNVKEIHIRNKHATQAGDVTVNFSHNGTLYELHKTRLAAGESLEYVDGIGWYKLGSVAGTMTNQSTSDQVTSAGVDTYLTGSNFSFPAGRLQVGTKFHWRIVASKSAAGTAAWGVNIRFGTAGTVSDNARVTMTQSPNVQTAVADVGTWEVRAIVRGPVGASCIVAGGLEFQHHLATTGFSTVSGADAYQATSAAFDSSTVTNVGLSINPGSAGVFTFQIVHGTAENI